MPLAISLAEKILFFRTSQNSAFLAGAILGSAKDPVVVRGRGNIIITAE
jgi:hypothetical protein